MALATGCVHDEPDTSAFGSTETGNGGSSQSKLDTSLQSEIGDAGRRSAYIQQTILCPHVGSIPHWYHGQHDVRRPVRIVIDRLLRHLKFFHQADVVFARIGIK